MSNKARNEVQREKQLIRKLMDIDNLADHEIINQLQIPERTFYHYKKRIMIEYTKLHDKQNRNSIKYREAKFHATLESGYLIAKRISEDRSLSPTARLEAIKVMCTCQAQLARLNKYGADFEPALPDHKVITIEPKESNV